MPCRDKPPLVLKLWGAWRTPTLPLLQGPLWSIAVEPVRVLSIGQLNMSANYLY